MWGYLSSLYRFDTYDPRMKHDLGKQIKMARAHRRLSIRLTAQRARISPTTLQGIEQGRIKNPRLATIFAIAGVLGLDPELLVEDEQRAAS